METCRNAEEKAHLLEKTVNLSGPSESNVKFTPAGFGYNKANKRPYRDGVFSIAFVAFTTAHVCVGIFAVFNHNSDFYSVSLARYDNSSKGCTVPKPWFHDAPSFSISKAISISITWLSRTPALYVLLATLILSAPLASRLLWVLRKHTKKMFLALPFMFTIVLVAAVLGSVSCVLQDGCKPVQDPSIYVLLIVLAYFFLNSVMWNNSDSVEVSIRVMGTAAEALHKNLGLLLVLPALRMVLILYYVTTVFAMHLAFANGKIVSNPKIAPYQDLNLEVNCTLWDGSCCVWETDRWVPAYEILAIFAFLWGVMVHNEVDMFTISGTISQWYFGAAQNPSRVNLGALNRSLRHALGPSFGTVCFAGLALGPTRDLRRESSRKKGRIARFLHEMIRGCVLSVLPCLEFMTNFTTDFAAITGEGFCSSASMACDVLTRNSLSTTLVANKVPRRLLMDVAFLSCALYGVLVWGVLALFVQNRVHRCLIAYLAFCWLAAVLSKCFQTVAHVVDSLYICYAIDKDNGEVSQPMVHDVYALLPPSPEGCFASLADSKVLP